MLSESEWHGEAGDEVRRCEHIAKRAAQSVESAEKSLLAAQDEQDAAERDLVVAKRVYFAGRKDITRQIGSPQITSQKLEWLKELSRHDVFGYGEMRDAAVKVGWSTTDGNLRAFASNYRKSGYFTRIDHGAMRLNLECIETALGHAWSNNGESELLTRPVAIEKTIIDGDFSDHSADRPSFNAVDDYMDDDLAF